MVKQPGKASATAPISLVHRSKALPAPNNTGETGHGEAMLCTLAQRCEVKSRNGGTYRGDVWVCATGDSPQQEWRDANLNSSAPEVCKTRSSRALRHGRAVFRSMLSGGSSRFCIPAPQAEQVPTYSFASSALISVRISSLISPISITLIGLWHPNPHGKKS